jgi:hypothetical protein
MGWVAVCSTGMLLPKAGFISTPQTSNHTFVRNMRITAFTNGYGIYDMGGNSIQLQTVTVFSM